MPSIGGVLRILSDFRKLRVWTGGMKFILRVISPKTVRRPIFKTAHKIVERSASPFWDISGHKYKYTAS